jgi:hypothetical protein
MIICVFVCVFAFVCKAFPKSWHMPPIPHWAYSISIVNRDYTPTNINAGVPPCDIPRPTFRDWIVDPQGLQWWNAKGWAHHVDDTVPIYVYIYIFFTMQATKSPYDVRIRRYSHYIVSFFPHLFVWNIYLHLGNFGSKCWKLFHTWSIGASGLVPNIGWRDPVGLLHWMEYSRRSTKRPGLRGNGHPWRFTVYRWCSSLFSHMGNCHLHIISIGIWYGHMAIIIGVCFIPIYF